MRLLDWITKERDSAVTGNWDSEGDALLRDLLTDFNDGIIASAAIIQGLLTGGATGHEAAVGVVTVIAIGMMAAGASKFNESAGERDNILAVYKAEQEAIRKSPEAEEQELVEIYEEKGLSHSLAAAVARELMDKDPLGAQLDDEFDIDEIPSRWWPWKRALYAAFSFCVGTVVPLLFLLILPWSVRGEATLAFVVAALALSGWIGHYAEHTSALRSMVRTVLVGLATLGVSTLAGTFVTF